VLPSVIVASSPSLAAQNNFRGSPCGSAERRPARAAEACRLYLQRVGELDGDLGSVNKCARAAGLRRTALALYELRRGVREAEEIEHLRENGRGGGSQVLVTHFEIAPSKFGSSSSSFIVTEPDLGSAGCAGRSPCPSPTGSSVA
jgi:hypothetical protein